jgi:putative transposase
MAHSELSMRRQCQLLSLNRSSLYYAKQPENALNLELMRVIDEIYTEMPFYGILRMTEELRQNRGYPVGVKRVRRLMRLMGLEALYPKPRTSIPNKEHTIYPYLLKGVPVIRPNQVWAADITYIPMKQGFAYLVAIMDWHSRYVLSWKVSISLDSRFCLDALSEALQKYGFPEMSNTDQGCQFTSKLWIEMLLSGQVRISMDGRGRCFDNIFVERLWRTVKYEDVYPKCYETVPELKEGLKQYFEFYNNRRLHQSLGYTTPAKVYFKVKNTGKEPNDKQ